MSDLNELFSTDPLSLTKDDPKIAEAIAAFRSMRARFELGDTRAGKVKAPTAVTKTKGLKELLEDSSNEAGDDDGFALKI